MGHGREAWEAGAGKWAMDWQIESTRVRAVKEEKDFEIWLILFQSTQNGY
jgi:hypothetical protein